MREGSLEERGGTDRMEVALPVARSSYDHVIRAQFMQMNAHPDVTQREGKMWLPSPSSIAERTFLK
jgi:hypothetical protein